MTAIAAPNLLEGNGSPEVNRRADRRIGAILAARGKLAPQQIDRVLELQKNRGLRFGEAAVRLGFISVNDLRSAIAAQYDLPHLQPDNARLNDELVVAYEPFHPCAEQLRALRAQLLIRWAAGDDSRTLAVVSPGAREGRSYVAANLAVAFAQLGERTLLIDADLRRPRQQLIFRVEDRVGVSAVLSGRADRSAIVPVPELGPLWLLPAGAPPPNPVELLSRDTLAVLLRELRNEFDVVLFDTPPTTAFADAQTVAFHARSALVLARKDHTRVAETTRAIRQVTAAGATTVGTVINAF